jgi:hypothetical protein
MSKTLKKFKKQYDTDDRHHDIKRRKLVFKNKELKSIDRVLRTKDVSKLINYNDV